MFVHTLINRECHLENMKTPSRTTPSPEDLIENIRLLTNTWGLYYGTDLEVGNADCTQMPADRVKSSN